jgi:hypothetical protein
MKYIDPNPIKTIRKTKVILMRGIVKLSRWYCEGMAIIFSGHMWFRSYTFHHSIM